MQDGDDAVPPALAPVLAYLARRPTEPVPPPPLVLLSDFLAAAARVIPDGTLDVALQPCGFARECCVRTDLHAPGVGAAWNPRPSTCTDDAASLVAIACPLCTVRAVTLATQLAAPHGPANPYQFALGCPADCALAADQCLPAEQTMRGVVAGAFPTWAGLAPEYSPATRRVHFRAALTPNVPLDPYALITDADGARVPAALLADRPGLFAGSLRRLRPSAWREYDAATNTSALVEHDPAACLAARNVPVGAGSPDELLRAYAGADERARGWINELLDAALPGAVCADALPAMPCGALLVVSARGNTDGWHRIQAKISATRGATRSMDRVLVRGLAEGDAMIGPVVTHALAALLVGSHPPPPRPVPLAARRFALRYVAAAAADLPAWIGANGELVTLALHYLRFMSVLADPVHAAMAWHNYGQMLRRFFDHRGAMRACALLGLAAAAPADAARLLDAAELTDEQWRALLAAAGLEPDVRAPDRAALAAGHGRAVRRRGAARLRGGDPGAHVRLRHGQDRAPQPRATDVDDRAVCAARRGRVRARAAARNVPVLRDVQRRRGAGPHVGALGRAAAQARADQAPARRVHALPRH
jgi:hypothetical protein